MVTNALAMRTLSKGYTKREKADWLDQSADWQYLTTQLAAALDPLIAQLVIETARQAYIDLGLDPAAYDPAVGAAATYASDRSLQVAIAINSETEKQLRAELGAGLAGQETAQELAARVEKVFGAALTYRASRTSSTEIVSAQGQGDLSAWDQSGLVESKEWYTAEDELVCPFCASLDGVIMPLDKPFFRMGDTITAKGEKMTVGFNDIHTTPLHVSCRCYLLDVKYPAL